MVAAFKNGGYSCKVLGASFRTVDQIKRLAVTGCQAVTVAPEMFDTLIAHASTVQTMENFKSLWTEKFHEAQISDFIPAE
jgi:transaldolase